jgi:hypothetical protein
MLHKAHMFVGARRCACSMMVVTWLHAVGVMQIPVCSLVREIDVDLEAGGCPHNGLRHPA